LFNNKPDREEIKLTQEFKILKGAMTFIIMTLSIMTFIPTMLKIIAMGI
jgi:hypothetical protein